MEVVVSSEQMREYDRFAIESLKIPGILLMENAGKGVVDTISRIYGSVAGKKFTIVCGKGNNGGDGFVVARQLHVLGAFIDVVLLARFTDVKSDAKVNLDILLKLIGSKNGENRLRIKETKSSKSDVRLEKNDFIIDAIFGTGFKGGITGLYKKAIDEINKSDSVKIAVDVPSGLDSDTGLVESVAVKADLTITIGFAKHGLTLYKSRNYTGLIKVIDSGVSFDYRFQLKSSTYLVHSTDIKNVLPKRSLTMHKYDLKKIYILAGSRGYTGAAAMVANSVLRSGGGLVVLGTPNSVYPILAKKLTEVMVDPLDETSEGTIGIGAKKAIFDRIEWADILILGPGLSKNAVTQEIIEDIVARTLKPVLVDADGLAAIPLHSSVWKTKSKRKMILTPHVGELSRLVGVHSPEIEDGRIETTREYAKRLNVILVLKGAPTVTVSPEGDVYINSTGNPGMATAGTGDILSGIIGGLLAQGLDEETSAYSGVYIHGLAGDMAKQRFGERSLMAMDIYEELPDAFKHIEKGGLIE
jgi:ADP-dependent NAD(P)H-hydrate dehydratase / NAD(P)H-hydrate epimerase